jgi:hypothetical protein
LNVFIFILFELVAVSFYLRLSDFVDPDPEGSGRGIVERVWRERREHGVWR